MGIIKLKECSEIFLSLPSSWSPKLTTPSQPVTPSVAKKELLRTLEKLILLKAFQLAIPSDVRRVPPKTPVKLTSLKKSPSQPATLSAARREPLKIPAKHIFL